MSDEHESIEHELVRGRTLVDFEIVDTHVEPTAIGDERHVRITLQMSEGDVECYAFGLVYVLGLLSFHNGRPRGYSGRFFEDDDEWSAGDVLRHLEFQRGRLYFDADYVRGRCLKTTVEVSSGGVVRVEERKTTRLPDDLRFIDDFKVYTRPDGEMRVKAEARLASELR